MGMRNGEGGLTIFVCSVFNLNNKNVNALIARELSGFTFTRLLTVNSKFSIPPSASSCGIEIRELVQVISNWEFMMYIACYIGNGKAIPTKCFVSHRPTDPCFWKSKKKKKKIRITCKEASTLVYKHTILSY